MRRAIWVLAVLLSHWRRHPMQLATLLIGLISATALWSGVQALNEQARESYDRAAAVFGGTRTEMLVSRSGGTFAQALFVELRRAGWPVSPVLEGRVQVGGRSLRLLGIEPVTLPREVGNAPTIGREGLQAFVTPPGATLVAPETLSDLHLAEDATPSISDGVSLPPLHVQPQLVPDVLVVDIGIAQELLNKPGQISRLLIGKSNGPRAPLESVAGDKLRLVQPDAESDLERLTDSFHLNLTAFGLLSFVVGLFIVNSAIGLAFEQRLPMLRTLRACGVSAAHAQRGAGRGTGVAGVDRGPGRVGLRLSDRGSTSARCRRVAARPLWRADSGRVDAQGGVVDCRPCHQRRRRLGRSGHESCESGPAVAVGCGATVCLATGPAPLADVPEHAFARDICRGRVAIVVRQFAARRIWRAGGPAIGCGADPARDPGSGCFISASAAPAARSPHGSGPTAASSFPDCRWR